MCKYLKSINLFVIFVLLLQSKYIVIFSLSSKFDNSISASMLNAPFSNTDPCADSINLSIHISLKY